jgi:hypothetical protein
VSILDKFLILFETDAGDAKDDIEGLGGALDDTEESAQGAALSIGDLAAAFVALSAIKSSIFDTAFNTDTVGKFSETLGFNIEKVDAWGAAVERNGGSAESFRGSISALNDQLTDLAIDGGGAAAQTLARLGIDANNAEGGLKGVFDLLPEIADSFQNLSKEESFGFGKRLGLDQGTILLLQQGRVAVSDLVNQQMQLGGMTEESYRASAEFNDELDNTGRAFDSLAQEANTTILPFLSNMLRGLQSVVEWMKQHKEFMVGFFAAIATAIMVLLIPAIKAMSATFAQSKLGKVAVMIMTIGTAFAALYEDVKRYTEGQSSFIGSLFEKYQWLEEGVKAAIDGIIWAWDQATSIFDWVKLFHTDPLSALDKMKDSITALWEYIKNLFDFESLFDFEMPSFFGGDKEGGSIFDSLPSWLGGSSDSDIAENTIKGLNTAQQYAQNPLNSGGGAMMFNSSQMQKSVSVAMGGVNIDARGMTTEQARGIVTDEFTNQLAGAVGQLDDGVDR